MQLKLTQIPLKMTFKERELMQKRGKHFTLKEINVKVQKETKVVETAGTKLNI